MNRVFSRVDCAGRVAGHNGQHRRGVLLWRPRAVCCYPAAQQCCTVMEGLPASRLPAETIACLPHLLRAGLRAEDLTASALRSRDALPRVCPDGLPPGL